MSDYLEILKLKVVRNIGRTGFAATYDFKTQCDLNQNEIAALVAAGYLTRVRRGCYNYDMTVQPAQKSNIQGGTPEELAAAKKGTDDTIGFIEENLTFAEIEYLQKHLPTVYLNSLHRMKEIDMTTYNMLLKIGFNYIPAGQKILATGVRKYIKQALEL